MKIVADENIPLVEHYFGHEAELLIKPGRSITRDDLIDADMLLVRSITKVDKLLLHDTPIKFVGSTTAGADHLDTQYLDEMNIQWSIAVACNAIAVAEYVVCVIAALQKNGLLTQKKIRAAVIGVGHVGQLVVEKLHCLGFEVVQCDPFRAEKEVDFPHVAIEDLSDVDFISVHTPLTHHGRHPSYHLIEEKFLKRQKNQCIVLNAGRGAVVAIDDFKQYGKHVVACFDVWEHEPEIDKTMLKSALIATPHIAGYSIQSKYRGIQMIYDAAIAKKIVSNKNIAAPVFPEKNLTFNNKQVDWRDVVLQVFDPRETTQQMRNHHETFDQLRKNFPDRYEFGYVKINDIVLSNDQQKILEKLGYSHFFP